MPDITIYHPIKLFKISMMDKLISIIVPIYNNEKYLSICIESIINQTYKNLEIILVDDGSTDNSKQICDHYAKIDSRIIIIHKINGGVSDARNHGLEIATGEYIGFVDSDDFIEPDMYEILLKLCIENQVKLSCAAYDTIGKKANDRINKKTTKILLSSEELLKTVILGDKSILVVNAIWNRLYHKDIIKNVKFPKGKNYGEETIFNTQVILNAYKGIYTYRKLYNYRIRNGSIMHSSHKGIFDPRIITDLIPLQNEQIKLLYLHNKRKLASIARVKYYTDLLIFRLINTYPEYKDFIDKTINIWKPSFFEMLMLPISIKKKSILILKACFPFIFKNKYIERYK